MSALSDNLYKQRKQMGLSQEELADKLGVSRQAISKWETGESLPDTANLIALSQLYNVSLDSLVGNTTSAESKTSSYVNIDKDGIHIHTTDDDDDVDVNIDGLGVVIDPGKKQHTVNIVKQHTSKTRLLHALFPLVITIAFLVWGFVADDWSVCWTLFVLVPVFSSLVDAVISKKVTHFAYPVLVTFVYLFIGMSWGLWHPYWVMFITIPIYYVIGDTIDKNAQE